jgi:methylthioribulose-1-phosphate dehydratase
VKDWPESVRDVAALCRQAHARGWIPGTSGNFSAVVSRDPLELAITPSGADKGSLEPEALLRIDATGAVLEGRGRPSAETALHVAIATVCGADLIAHTHSRAATLASDTPAPGVSFQGYELLKGLAGVSTHEHVEFVPVVDNTQEWSRGAIEEMLRTRPGLHGFLIKRHGLYTWGRDAGEALRHLEVLEFLLDLHLAGTARVAKT